MWQPLICLGKGRGFTNNVQGIENKDLSIKAAQTMEIHSIMDIEDGLMNGIPTMTEEVNNDD